MDLRELKEEFAWVVNCMYFEKKVLLVREAPTVVVRTALFRSDLFLRPWGSGRLQKGLQSEVPQPRILSETPGCRLKGCIGNVRRFWGIFSTHTGAWGSEPSPGLKHTSSCCGPCRVSSFAICGGPKLFTNELSSRRDAF